MVRPIPNHVVQTYSSSPIPLSISLFVTITLLVALCAKHARKSSPEKPNEPRLKSRLPSTAQQLILSVGHKAMVRMVQANKKSGEGFDDKKLSRDEKRGVWQKAIMMGEKCKPPEFSGVIYYDHDGNRIQEMPKSPRLGPTLYVEKLIDKSVY